jgi:hypothetical protein
MVASSSLTLQRGRDRGGRTPWLPAWVSSSSSHGAPNATRFDPTLSIRQGDPFCKLTAKETVDGECVTAARFGQCFATVRAASGGALALRTSSTASPCNPQAPPWVNCFGRRCIKLMR